MVWACVAIRRGWVKKCIEYEVDRPGQEVDQRKLAQRLWRRTVRHVD